MTLILVEYIPLQSVYEGSNTNRTYQTQEEGLRISSDSIFSVHDECSIESSIYPCFLSSFHTDWMQSLKTLNTIVQSSIVTF